MVISTVYREWLKLISWWGSIFNLSDVLNNHRLDLPHDASLNPIRLLSVCPINETEIYDFKEYAYFPTTYVVRGKEMLSHVFVCSQGRGGSGVHPVLVLPGGKGLVPWPGDFSPQQRTVPGSVICNGNVNGRLSWFVTDHIPLWGR